jgi:hypothetical protein
MLFPQDLNLPIEDLIHFANLFKYLPLFDCTVSVHVFILPNRLACDSPGHFPKRRGFTAWVIPSDKAAQASGCSSLVDLAHVAT